MTCNGAKVHCSPAESGIIIGDQHSREHSTIVLCAAPFGNDEDRTSSLRLTPSCGSGPRWENERRLHCKWGAEPAHSA